jgi:hypothetical protein
MNNVHVKSFGIGANKQAPFSRATTPVPGDLENGVLRQAVQENLVSFPSQVPVFEKQSRPDLQQKLALLYFVCGWTTDDIAKRYGLGPQRMWQILTAWRIHAVKEGYMQAIEPAHPLLQRVRLEEARTSQSSEMPVRASPVAARAPKTGPAVHTSEAGAPRPAMPSATGLGGPNLAEQLHAIVDILDNQLLLCSKPLNGNIDSCEPLLAHAKTLCERLEAQISATHTNDEERTTAVIAAAQELFQRFHRASSQGF